MSTVYRQVQGAAPVPINNNPTVVVQLRVPDKNSFIIFGRVVFTNQDQHPQPLTATLTTFNGGTVLDKVNIAVDAGKAVCVSLQAILNLNENDQNDIVDIRCASLQGQAEFGALTALSIDS
jgi:hypothetical protein